MRIIGFDPIENESKWKASGLSLGQVVHAVVQHLQLNPPIILEITDPGLQAIQPKTSRFAKSNGTGTPANAPHAVTTASRNGHASAAPPSYDAHQQYMNQSKAATQKLPPPPDVPLPTIPRDFRDFLNPKTDEEIEGLLKNELDFLTLVHNVPVFQEIRKIATSKANETRRMAQDNLDCEGRLKSSQAEVEQLRNLLIQKLKAFQALESRQNALCAPPDVQETLRKLKESKKQGFDESEAFAEGWVDDGASNVDQFLKDFIAKRKIHHERAAKMEILEQEQQRNKR
jgi:Modifier of rudimentary (Mod(r)) protein